MVEKGESRTIGPIINEESLAGRRPEADPAQPPSPCPRRWFQRELALQVTDANEV